MTQPETITMTEQKDDLVRELQCIKRDGSWAASVRLRDQHPVCRRAAQALATARAEAEALREALTAHNLRAANGDEITVADELEQAASTLEAFVVADKEHPLLDCADDDGVEYQSEYMASLMDHATINARTLRKWAHSLRAALRARNEGEG